MLRFIPVVDRDSISWPDKYVSTDAEAADDKQSIVIPPNGRSALRARSAS